MVVLRRASVADFLFTAQEYDDELRVLQFNGTEAMSEPFRYSFRLAAQDSEIDFDTIIGKTACLTISGEVGDRYVHGMVNKLTQAGTGSRYTIYNLELVPSIWLLTMRYDCRIFQDMNVRDIINQVLTDAGIVSDSFRFELNGTHNNREYCVQYRETDLNFISRLMEEEGIFYFFEHNEDSHVLVMADNASVFTRIEPEDSATIPFNEASGMVPNQESIYGFRFSQQIRTSTVSLQDFYFEQPTSGLSVMALSGEESPAYEEKLEIYDYPGEYTDHQVGADLAQIRLDAIRTNRKSGFGQSTCRRFIPGYKYVLERYTRSDLNQEYLITRLTTSATQPLGEDSGDESSTYSNEFECIPSSIPFRPSRKAIKPMVEGVQTAMVTGPGGEEIYTDEYGRIKVQFHWDRKGQHDERSSCWIRVSQLWAGEGWGAIYIPRIGQEVIVDFLEGDPDRPIITGRVYNGDNATPYALPDDKTKSTIKSNSYKGGGGYNELRFEDIKGSEEVYVHAQKDMNEKIENNMSTNVGANQSLNVGNDRTKTVGHDQSETIKNNKTIQVDNDHTETINNNKTLNVGVNHTETIGSSMTISIGQNLTETVTLNYSETVGVAMELNVGAAYSETIGATKTESVGASKEVDIGTDLSETVGGDYSEQVAKDYSLKAKKITIEADDQITIKTGQASITMKKNGDIKISGKKIEIEGMQDIKIKGMNIAAEAQVKNELKGTMINAEASGINTIKGSLVKIN